MRRAGTISRTRRSLLQAAGMGLLLPGCATRLIRPPPHFARDPFVLGVASGEPLADGFVIWSRLAPFPIEDPTGAGGMPPQAVDVEWRVATDEELRHVVREGVAIAEPDWAHSLHVEVHGLLPDRPYWYAFRVGPWQSRIGRARTAPAPGMRLDRLRFAFASCQHFETGFYAAYRQMVDDAPDLILHLGDYIYEGSTNVPVRRHEGPEPRDLPAYRRRHATYKLDRDLQAAHAQAPWLMTWDDHEVENDYAGLVGSQRDESPDAFRARRAAAYRAYWEHMPLRLRARPKDERAQLYAAWDFGDLLRIHVLDLRQYRSDQACATPQQLGGWVTDCAERVDPDRTMLGAEQETWLQTSLDQSPARWNFIAQTTLMAPLDQRPGPEQAWWTDGWDGYPAARDRLLGFIASRRPVNPVVIGGDVHSFWATDLHAPGQANADPIASEFVGSSISSPGGSQESLEQLRADNPHIKFSDTRFRGYVLCDLDAGELRTQFRAVEQVRNPASAVRTLASFLVEAGRPGPRPI